MNSDGRADVQRLRELRRKVAALTRQLAERELDARLLRLGIETERRSPSSGTSRTLPLR